jgi:ElaB/YqjD/DUF883 family membrane-anchored ribosome-binding protein
MAEKELQAELDHLRAEMAKLRADFAGVSEALKSAGKAEAASIKESASEFAETAEAEVKRLLGIIRDKSKKSVEVVEHQVGEHPFVALLAAFGIGFLIAKLTDRK